MSTKHCMSSSVTQLQWFANSTPHLPFHSHSVHWSVLHLYRKIYSFIHLYRKIKVVFWSRLYQARTLILSLSSSLAQNLISVQAQAEPSLEIQLTSKPKPNSARYTTCLWARAEPGSDFELVNEPSRASIAQNFWLKLAQALASFLHFVICEYYKV